MTTPMQIVLEVARGLSAIAFLSYGIACLVTPRMEAEFTRYGLARFRRLIGALECLGALGLLVGHFNRPVLVLAAAGLALTMLAAIATRVRIGDSLAQTIPAIVLCALNALVLGSAIMDFSQDAGTFPDSPDSIIGSSGFRVASPTPFGSV